jgi:Domain of unknown function (DUF6438)
MKASCSNAAKGLGTRLIRCSIFTAFLAMASCTPRQLDTSDLLITLSRDGNCFNCPWYSVTIHADGQTQFNGVAGTQVHGERFASIEHDSILHLAQDILEMGIFDRNDRYESRKLFDGSTTTIDIRLGGMHKQIIDLYGAPDSVRFIERRIDQLSGALLLIGNGPDPPSPVTREARSERRSIDSLEAIDDEMLQRYEDLRSKGDLRHAYHLFYEERKLNDSIAKAYKYFLGTSGDSLTPEQTRSEPR